jgi:hypothetical protein
MGDIADLVFDPDPEGQVLLKVLEHLALRSIRPLRDARRFHYSGGVYLLHYGGPHPLYRTIRAGTVSTPIYIGKSDQNVSSRLRNHCKTLQACFNLKLDDFTYQVLQLPAEWAVLVEALLHKQHNPCWIQRPFCGFGNNDPGGNRRGGKASNWDTLHPGRAWALGQDRSGEGAVLLKAAQERWLQENEGPIQAMFGVIDPETLSEHPENAMTLEEWFGLDSGAEEVAYG